MPEPTKIPRPFADSGDKNSIPDSSGGLGFACWQEGFPAITGTPFAQGGVAPKRADFNGIFNALSLAILWQQQGGFYAYDNTTDYEVGNVAEYSGDLYKCLVANGPGSAVKAPTDTTVWSKVMTSADVAALYLPLSGGTMTGEIKTTYANLGVRTTTDAELRISGGTGLTDGATVIVYGKDSGNVGAFRIRAYNNHDLIGSSSGRLTWDGKEVTRQLYADLFSESFIFENIHNLQIIADHATASNGTVVNFGRAFASGVNPIVIAQHPGTAATANVRAHTITPTGFTVYSEFPTAITVNYIAIGKGQ